MPDRLLAASPSLLVIQRSEEPELVPDERSRHLHGGVSPLLAVIRAAVVERCRGVARRQRVVLEVDVGIAVQLVATLAGDDVEDRALHVAVFGGRAELQDLDLLDGVGVGPGCRADLRPVDMVGVLVGARAERCRGRGRADVRRLAHAGRRVDQVEVREPPDRRVLHPLLVVAGAHLCRRGVHDGRIAGDRDRLLERAHFQRDVQCHRVPDGHRNGLAPQRAETGQACTRRRRCRAAAREIDRRRYRW